MSDPTPCVKCGRPHVRADGKRGCSGHRKDGAPCGQMPMRGQTVCARRHGGKARQNLAAAERRLAAAAAEADAAALLAHEGVPDPVDVGAELSRLASEVSAMRVAVARRVNALQSVTDESGRLAVEIGIYERSLDRSARVLDVIGRLRLDERRADLDAERLQLVRVALGRAIAAAELGADARATVLRVFAAEIRVGVDALEGSG